MSQKRRVEANSHWMGHRKRVKATTHWNSRVADLCWMWANKRRRSAIMKEGKIRRIKPPWKVHVGV